MKEKHLIAYMRTAKIFADLSIAQRLHVGAIVVKDDRIISIGYNGMPAGWDNNCEDKEYMDRGAGGWLNPDEIEHQWPLVGKFWIDTQEVDTRYRLVTKPEVLHAERNALDKLAKGSEGGDGATMFVTHSPCLECAKSIYGAGIKRVYFGEQYRSEDGIHFLKKCGVKISELIVE
jgi:dCMP deaminase